MLLIMIFKTILSIKYNNGNSCISEVCKGIIFIILEVWFSEIFLDEQSSLHVNLCEKKDLITGMAFL